MNHEISEEFSSEIRKFESTDRASADVLNEPIGVLANNDAYLKKALENLDIRCAQTSLQITQECAASLVEAKEYTADEVEKLVDGAPLDYNTLAKIVNAMSSGFLSTNEEMIAMQNEMNSIWTSKASHSDITGENLIPYPYVNKTVENRNGIAWTDLGNGHVKVHGTASASSDFYLFYDDVKLEAGTYTISGMPEQDPNSIYIFLNWYKAGTYVKTTYCKGTTTITLTESDISTYTFRLGMRVSKDVTANNAIFKPMLEKGSHAHEYQPYNISRQGIIEQIVVDNLIPYPYSETTSIENEISWVDNGDGTLTVSGTATENSFFTISIVSSKILSKLIDGEVYTLSDGYGNTDCYLYLEFFDADGNVVGTRYRTNKGAISFIADKSVATKMTITAYVPKGTTLTNVKLKPMLERGSVAHSYQPYTLSRKGIVKQISGENLLPFPYYHSFPITNRGIKFEDYDGKGGVKANGTDDGTGQPHFICEAHKIQLKANQPYTFASNCTDDRGFITIWFRNADGSGITMSYTEIRNGIASTQSGNAISGLKGGVISDEVTFIPSKDMYMQFDLRFDTNVGTVTDAIFYPMIEKGTVAHPYQQYTLSRKGITEQIVVDNLLPYPFNGEVTEIYEKNGLTFTDNGDGTVTVNGTATAETLYHLKIYNNDTYGLFLGLVKGEKYTLSGCPSGGSTTTYNMSMAFRNGSTTLSGRKYDTGSGVVVDTNNYLTADRFQVVISIASGVTVNNLTFKPMLEKGTVAHPYTEYRKSHAKLREDLDTLMEDTGWITLAEAGEYSGFTVDEAISYRVIRNKLYIAGTVSFSGAESSLGAMVNLGTLPSDIIIPHSIEKAFAHNLSSTVVAVFSVQINSNGHVILAMSKNTTNNSASLYKKYFEECILLD